MKAVVCVNEVCPKERVNFFSRGQFLRPPWRKRQWVFSLWKLHLGYRSPHFPYILMGPLQQGTCCRGGLKPHIHIFSQFYRLKACDLGAGAGGVILSS